MNEINEVMGLQISVYHNFRDEIDQARQHVWLCNGQCASQPPYFGVVQRSRNMPPGPNDFWFQKHQKSCGGEFIKILEPPPAETKRKIIKPKSRKPVTTENNPNNADTKTKAKPVEKPRATLDSFFGNVG